MGFERDRHVEYDQTSRKIKRIPPAIDSVKLRRLAEDYVQKFGGPSSNVRRMLQRYIERSVHDHASDREQLQTIADQIVAHLLEALAVNDARYAELRAQTLSERGQSQRLIAMKLRQKGLSSADVNNALAELGPDRAIVDLNAARALVKRRRLGALRPQAERADKRQRDLAALMRGGFAYDIAKRALDRPTDDDSTD